LDEDFAYDGSLKSASLNLKKGFHPVTLYFKKTDDKTPKIDFTWSKEGNEPKDVSENIMTF
jgi:hypothetical protein